MELWHVRKIAKDNQHLVQFLHLQLLGRLGDLTLLLDDAPQRLLALRVHFQVLLDVLLGWIQPLSMLMEGLKM